MLISALRVNVQRWRIIPTAMTTILLQGMADETSHQPVFHGPATRICWPLASETMTSTSTPGPPEHGPTRADPWLRRRGHRNTPGLDAARNHGRSGSHETRDQSETRHGFQQQTQGSRQGLGRSAPQNHRQSDPKRPAPSRRQRSRSQIAHDLGMSRHPPPIQPRSSTTAKQHRMRY